MRWAGLDDFVKELEIAEKNVSKNLDKVTREIASETLAEVKLNTPVNKDPRTIAPGTLRGSWKVRSTDVGEMEIFNDAHTKNGEYYAWDVEYGHRTRAGMGKKMKKGKVILFIPGMFMLKTAMDNSEEIFEEKVTEMLEKIFGGK